MTRAADDPQAPVSASPIALVGIGCLFPDARDRHQFWGNLAQGHDAVRDVPASHWDRRSYFDPDPRSPDRTYGHRGAFVPRVDFAPLDFGIRPDTLEATDTTQLLGLWAARQALTDAGYGDGQRPFDRDRTAVILGVTGTLELVIPLGARLGHPLWRRALDEAGVDPETADRVVQTIAEGYVPWQENSFPGLLGNVAAGRIANRLDLGGTNCVVDAACASSLAALHLAVLELQCGQSDMVLSGGLDTFNDIFMYMCFSKTPALSASGHARPFDADGDGTTLGEGLGVVVLKRLNDAVRDGDRIYAVLRGLGSSSDGRGRAVYAPAPEGQRLALRRAYRVAGITPTDLDLIEAHGTGTRVGDAVELQALTEVFCDVHDANSSNGRQSGSDNIPTLPWCALGSVKSQIGHTKAAAGAASLIKVALALHHKVLPPTIKVRTPLDPLGQPEGSDASPFFLHDRATPWIASPGRPRRAGLSAFGFGGSNYHAVLEEHDPTRVEPVWDPDGSGEVELVALVADQPGTLHDWVRTHLPAGNDLEDESTWLGVQVQAALTRRRFSEHPGGTWRLLLVVDRDRTAYERLHRVLDKALSHPNMVREGRADAVIDPAAGVFLIGPDSDSHASRSLGTPRLAMLFPGQGSQYVGMLRELACRFPEALDALNLADTSTGSTDSSGSERLSRILYPPADFDDPARREADRNRLTATIHAQPALGAVAWGACGLLGGFGIQPDLVAGHSYGELVALAVAGAFDTSTLFALSRRRGQLMAEMASKPGSDPGTMLALAATLEQTRQLIADHRLDLVVANHNGSHQVILSGTTPEIERAHKTAGRLGITAKPLSVAAAFHSRLVAEAATPFADHLERIAVATPRIPVYSNTTARAYPDDPQAIRHLLANQLAEPVDFVAMVRAMYRDGARLFLEVGPGTVLTRLVEAILDGEPHRAIALDSSQGRRTNLQDLARCLAGLVAAGYPVELNIWGGPFARERVRRVEDPAPPKPKLVVPLCGANYRSTLTGSTMPDRNDRANDGDQASVTEDSRSTASDPRRSLDASPLDPTSTDPLEPTATAPDPPERSLSDPRMKPESSPAATSTSNPQQLDPSIDPEAPTIANGHGYNYGHRMPPDPTPQPDAPIGSGHLSRSLEQSLIVLHEMAQQTAELHRRFLENQERLQHNVRVLLDPATVEPHPFDGANQQPEPSMIAPTTAGPEHHTPATPHLDSNSKNIRNIPRDELPLDDTPKHIDTLPTSADSVSGLSPDPTPRPAPSSASFESESAIETPVADLALGSGPGLDGNPRASVDPSLTSILLDVISEKTGYPTEMLEPTMELDADLGIDSIKRVEILAALQERLPELPEVQPEQLGKLRSLDDIVLYLERDGGAVHESPASTATAQPADFSSAETSNGSTSIASHGHSTPNRSTHRDDHAQAVLLEVISEKTGYPAEMLEPTMELDADLGIDSIKRVEILAALQERLPELPEVQPEQLGRLRTIAEIVDCFQDEIGKVPVGVEDSPRQARDEPIDASSTSMIPSSNSLWNTLLDVISEKTGYPAEMLEPTMELDADLGIDSIKRVEILAALQERLPQLPEVQPEQLGRLRTLQEITVHLKGTGQSDGPPDFTPTGGSVPEPLAAPIVTPEHGRQIGAASDHALRTFQVVLRPLDSGHDRDEDRLRPQGEILVIGPPEPLVHALVRRIDMLGQSIRSVPWDRCESIAWTDQLSGLVMIAPSSGFGEGTNAGKASVNVALPAFTLLQHIGARLRESGREHEVVLALVSRMDGGFGFDDPTRIGDPSQAGLAGLAKTAAREWPEVYVKAIDVPSSQKAEDFDEVVLALAEEILTRRSIEVGIAEDGTQRVLALDEITDSLQVSEESESLWGSEHTVVLTGGARGVTAEVALALAHHGRPNLVLIGRTAPPQAEPDWLQPLQTEAEIIRSLLSQTGSGSTRPTPKEAARQARRWLAHREVRRTLDRLTEAGSRVLYLSADVRDRDGLDRALREARATFGPIHGLVHAAGILADRRILDKSTEDFEHVYRTKVDGARHLLESLSEDPLTGLVLFSSTTARLGRIGQADYAAANEVLNKLSQQFTIDHPNCRTLALNWGPWDGGMVHDGLKSLFENEGVGLIPLKDGAHYVVSALAESRDRGAPNAVERVVIHGPLPETDLPQPKPQVQIDRVQDLDQSTRSPTNHRLVPDHMTRLDHAFTLRIAPGRMPVLRSHVIGGSAVVPLALAIEWLGHAALHAHPGLRFFGLDNLQVCKGIVLEDDAASMDVEVFVGHAEPDDECDRVTVELRESVADSKPGRPLIRARVLLGEQTPNAPDDSISNTDSSDDSTLLAPFDLYGPVLFHGPDLHAFVQVDCCDADRIVTRIRTAPRPSLWLETPLRGTWIADPLVLDGVFQGLVLWASRVRGLGSLPNAVGAYRQYQRRFDGPEVVAITRITRATAHQVTADIEIRTPTGSLIARLSDCTHTMDASLLEAFAQTTLAQGALS